MAPTPTPQKGKFKAHTVVPLGQWSKARPKLCPLHRKDLDLFCVKDQCTVCIYCLQLSGDHQHHQVISMAEAVTRAKVCTPCMHLINVRCTCRLGGTGHMLSWKLCRHHTRGLWEGKLVCRGRRAKFQWSPSHVQPFGGMCVYGIFRPSLAQWDLGTYFSHQESKQWFLCIYIYIYIYIYIL